MHIEIYPLEKVKIDTAEIYLEMEKSALEAAIGKGQLLGNRYYYNCEMAVDYGPENSAKQKMERPIYRWRKRHCCLLTANENAIPFYEKLGMKKAEDVMQLNHIEWTDFTVK